MFLIQFCCCCGCCEVQFKLHTDTQPFESPLSKYLQEDVETVPVAFCEAIVFLYKQKTGGL